MPMILRPAGVPETAGASAAVGIPELVPRNCRLEEYTPIDVPSVRVSSDVIAYTSPDSTFAVTKRLLDQARTSILIGIYDFTAAHVKLLIEKALARGVKVELMLDLDGQAEQRVFRDLGRLGADCTPAPACSSKRHKVFRSSHEKVIVVDDEWCLVQSGNYSDNSIPLNVKDGGDPDDFTSGNRDTGLAIRSKPLARFFREVLEADIALELEGTEAAAALPTVRPDTFLIEAAPTRLPNKFFPSKTFNLSTQLTLQPVLSPDNYMSFVPDRLGEARTSVLIQQQYIRAAQSDIDVLLTKIKEARDRHPDLDIRILLGKLFNKGDLPKERANLKVLKTKFGLKLGTNIRYINTDTFVHCHNKLILVDSDGVLVSSQNWSNAAVSENREAGLWFEHRGIANYFRAIFEHDWKIGFKDPADTASPESVGPETVRRGGFIRVEAGDFKDV
jgi:phosphatidylserine/phosphatidylglycerophosphate/cardiolipin synthase-like enzyme